MRDLLRGETPHDWDIATAARPNEMKMIFAGERVLETGLRHGTLTLLIGREPVEITSFRADGDYSDGRRPDEVRFTRSLEEDLSRRDFTINAMAISVNADGFGTIVDRYNGINDLNDKLIRTPLDPDITFSDDPLRMMRAIRFATQLQFTIVPETYEAIKRNASRISIISKERIVDELMKIMSSPTPSIGWSLLLDSGLLQLIFPALAQMKGVEVVKGRGHKDNFYHTLAVLDNVARQSDNVWLRWGALLHDIAKPVTKRWDDRLGWTFHNHNFIGARMIPRLFREIKLPLNEKMKYVQKMVELHMRPISLVEDGVTDSAVRRLLVDAGDDIDDLMILCKADITSKNEDKVRRFIENFDILRNKMDEIEAKDKLRNWQPPIDGLEIMQTFGLSSSPAVGVIKEAIRNAILDGEVANTHEAAHTYMLKVAADNGIFPVNTQSSGNENSKKVD